MPPADRSPVVVGVDGSSESAAAAKWAAAIAQRYDAPLELINGLPSRSGALSELTDAAAALWSAAAIHQRDCAGTILKLTEEEVRAEFSGLDVVTLACDVPVHQVLTERSRTARMVVLGSEAVTPAEAILVGSTTLAVSAHSACPVVAWRGGVNASTRQPVVLAVEDAATGPAAFDAAFEFASRFGVGLNAVHTWFRLRPPPGLTSSFVMDWDGLEALQWQGLMSVLEPWTNRYPDVEVTYFVEPEAATKALLRHAAEAQLMIVGSRHHNAWAGALLGSTSLNLLHHCQIPIMLCHRQSDA
ncbi:universal stress protein UspA [Mycolicibacterium celeriflavum]|uniref:universal stress protein n=1 Tax=Mycolicibacterium celeriflavum TaxID=1249101 RepID=UPI0007FF0DB3|nr:universal stress protein [Mycolicibacterium celeriflavum]OBG18836.1 universal stress protein UspA [Mycolicibacterium celeriflavum]